MSMAVIAGVVSVAGTAYGAYAGSQGGGGGGAGGAGGGSVKTPEAAEYKPVDFSEEQMNTILGNIDAIPNIGRLMKGSDRLLTQQALRRAGTLIPGYEGLMRTMGANAGNLMNGQLPYDDVLNAVSNRAALTNSLGIGGTAQPATLKDLGIGQLDAMKTGGSMMQQMVGMAETISPIGRYMTPQMMMLTPLDRIKMSMEQNQLIQQSDQNKNNLEALGASNLAPSGGGGSGGGAGIGSALSGVGSLLGSFGGMGGGASSSLPPADYSSLIGSGNAAPTAVGQNVQPRSLYSPQASMFRGSTGLYV